MISIITADLFAQSQPTRLLNAGLNMDSILLEKPTLGLTLDAVVLGDC
jgi:hypothetical protein